MAEWKERGFVPDSDDEEEDELEGRDRDSLTSDTGLIITPKRVHNGSQEDEKSLLSNAQIPTACESKNDDPATLAHLPHHNVIASELDSEKFPDQTKNKRDGLFAEKQNETREEGWADQVSPTTGHTQVAETRNSVAEQLQNELTTGLEIVKEILGDAPINVKVSPADRSCLSSPLSSVQSFSAEDDLEELIRETTLKEPITLGSQPLQQHFEEVVHSGPDYVADFGIGAQFTKRNLRHRNPIQLHPYALEGARYQQELLARGLKPVHLAGSLRRSTAEAVETQDCEFREDDAGDDSQDIPSSQQESSGPLQPIHNGVIDRLSTRRAIDLAGSDDELPDLEAILEGKRAGLPWSRKRSKADYRTTQNANHLNGDDHVQLHNLHLDAAQFTLSGLQPDAIFHVPPSPPHSRGSQSSRSSERLPKRLIQKHRTPQTLPTPNVSSAAQQPVETPLESNNDSDDRETAILVDSSSQSSQRSLGQGESQILQFQKRTKGVLPASFFRLRQQQEIRRQNQARRSSSSPDRHLDVPGVAHSLLRPFVPPNSPSRASNNPVVVSDDSSDDQSMTENFGHPAASNSVQRHYDVMGLVDGDIEEDNGIDMMLQPQARKRKPRDPAKKRQRRLTEFAHDFDHPQTGDRFSVERSPKRSKGPNKPALGTQMWKQKRSKAAAPSLDPLDAPGYTEFPRIKQPHFLRVAARRARSRRTVTRQSPSRETLQLAIRGENDDARTELDNWRESLPKQNARSLLNAQPRKFLQPREHLRQQSLQSPALSRSGTSHLSPSLNDRSRGQIEQRSPLRRRTEDVIQEAVLRSRDDALPSTSHFGAQQQDHFDDVVPGSFLPIASVCAHHENRAGRGSLLSSTTGFAKSREAQVESISHRKNRHRIFKAFQGRLSPFYTDDVRNQETSSRGDRVLARNVNGTESDTIVENRRMKAIARPVKKRPPTQIDLTSLNADLMPKLSYQVFNTEHETREAISGVVFAGLGSPEYTITVGFGVAPLQEGTFLHQISPIGKGQLSTTIHDTIHNNRRPTGRTTNVFAVHRPLPGSPPYCWGVWDDLLAQEISAWFVELRDCLGQRKFQDDGSPQEPMQSILAATSSLITYLSYHAIFWNHQDLAAFAEIGNLLLQEIVQQFVVQIESTPSTRSDDVFSFSSLLLLVIFQIAHISGSVDHRPEIQLGKLFKSLALAVLELMFGHENLANVVRLSRDDCPMVEALVTINILSKQPVLQNDVWDLITDALQSSIGFLPEGLFTFQDYDSWWKGIFASLPFLEFDESGLLQRMSSSPAWDLVQRLLLRYLRLFIPRRHIAGYSTKHYGRILVQRCLDFVQVWGWQGGHSAIGTLFDAYNSNDMGELFGEMPEHHFCVPLSLVPGTCIRVGKTDSGFHAFLALLAQTILDARKPDADQKLAKRVLRSLSARLVPTSCGDLPRSKPPIRNDVITLRNRFDLVSVMYCAMPSGMKPNLRLFQSFVDFRYAHIEACKLALQCWSRIVQHEAFNDARTDESKVEESCNNSASPLSSLREWHELTVKDLLAEYSSTLHKNSVPVEVRLVDSVRASDKVFDSRRLTAEVLKEALTTWEQVFEFCHNARQASELIAWDMLGDLLRLFHPEDPLSNTIVSGVLQIIKAYMRISVPRIPQSVSVDEDSQEYGSWDDFDEVISDNKDHRNSNEGKHASALTEVRLMMRCFLSNVFGSDVVPEHAILKSVADCWYEVADALVRFEARSWNDFVSQYSTDSWDSLRRTQQAEQYKVYFLAKVVDEHYEFYDNARLQVLNLWISSLCRPQYLLCWEHLLTSTILFHDSDNELLFNPPFAIRSDAGDRVEISMKDFTERRRVMIYVVLRNMHRLLAMTTLSFGSGHLYSKSDFSEILRGMENTMRNAYQDLEADPQAQTEYRAFLNFVIQQMQLYIVDFYQIDSFFTDPAIFSAEAYAVTAALKRYSLTIQSTGVTKAMVLFLYNASERAAINDTQDQFIQQLNNTLLDLSQEAIERIENHDSDAALLLSYLHHIFPAYINHAFSSPGHIIAMPILQVLTHIYQTFRCRSDLWNPVSLRQFIIATESILLSAIHAFQASSPSTVSFSPVHLKTSTQLIRLIHAAILRTHEAGQAFPIELNLHNLIELVLVLKDHVLAINLPCQPDHEHDSDSHYCCNHKCDLDSDLLMLQPDLDVLTNLATSAAHSSGMRTYAERELRTSFERTWRQDRGGGWEIVAGGGGRGTSKVVRAGRRAYGPGPGPGNGSDGVVDVDAEAEGASSVEMEECKASMRFVVREFLDTFVGLDWWEED